MVSCPTGPARSHGPCRKHPPWTYSRLGVYIDWSSEQRSAGQLVADDEAHDADHGDAAVDELRVGGEHGEATPVLATLPRHTLRKTVRLSRLALMLVPLRCEETSDATPSWLHAGCLQETHIRPPI